MILKFRDLMMKNYLNGDLRFIREVFAKRERFIKFKIIGGEFTGF
jgi:hypothetical protein